MTGISALAAQAWAENKAQVGTMEKKLLGWEPIRLQKEWEREFLTELKALEGGQRGDTMENCLGEGRIRS